MNPSLLGNYELGWEDGTMICKISYSFLSELSRGLENCL